MRLDRLGLLGVGGEVGDQRQDLGGGGHDQEHAEAEDDAHPQDVGGADGQDPGEAAGQEVHQRGECEGQHAAEHEHEDRLREVGQQPAADHQHRQPGQDDQRRIESTQPGIGAGAHRSPFETV